MAREHRLRQEEDENLESMNKEYTSFINQGDEAIGDFELDIKGSTFLPKQKKAGKV